MASQKPFSLMVLWRSKGEEAIPCMTEREAQTKKFELEVREGNRIVKMEIAENK